MGRDSWRDVRALRACVGMAKARRQRWIGFKLPRGVLLLGTKVHARILNSVAYERWYNLQATMADGGWMSQM